MGYCRQTSLPVAEPVPLGLMRQFLRLPDSYTNEDAILQGFISAAREKGEVLTCRALAQRTFVQVLDSHPYYTDTIQSQLAYPPNYYSLPRYSTTLWNYSQMIKLGYSPVVSVQGMTYIAPDGSAKVLHADTDFVVDRISEPSRIFPIPGTYWPADLYVANAVQIDYTAGYDPDPAMVDVHQLASPPPALPGQQPTSTIVTGVPQLIILGILNLVALWFRKRGTIGQVPDDIAQIFLDCAVIDFSPTRG
ncbi:MAG: hypothetical protein LAQ69_22500 [Acidobacteriia bacterium]|nr:hypothetical protein [Terriglobia bacterium]